jgi:hypothetical protein
MVLAGVAYLDLGAFSEEEEMMMPGTNHQPRTKDAGWEARDQQHPAAACQVGYSV